jgi:integrase
MARSRLIHPTYRKHRQTGRAAVSIYRPDGSRSEIILPGKYGSKESREAYESLLARLRANDGKLPDQPTVKHDLTIAELVLKFMAHARDYYVDPTDKTPTSEIAALRAAMRPLVRLFKDTPAAEFGPLALQDLRKAMVSGSWLSDAERAERVKAGRPIGMARSTCNKNVNRVKLLFKWAGSMEMVPSSVPHGLATVAGLRRGRSAARETEPVSPISAAVIEDTLPHLPVIVADMVELLLLTGMRCGELCIMRACDLDMSGDVWLYRPERHKGKWRGRQRVVAIGPRAQGIIRKHLTASTTAYLFRPCDQHEAMSAAKRAARKSRVQPSQHNRRKRGAKRRPGDRFKVAAVNRAIRRTCERMGIENWHVHQLRHSASLAFTRELGLEHCRAALGHASVDMSAMYAGQDIEAAKKVAGRVG